MTLSGADPTVRAVNAARSIDWKYSQLSGPVAGPERCCDQSPTGQPLLLIYTYQYYV